MLFKTLDRTVHESSNRSDNHYHSLKFNLEKILKVQSVSWIISINITLLFGIIFTNYFKQINLVLLKLYQVINILNNFYRQW